MTRASTGRRLRRAAKRMDMGAMSTVVFSAVHAMPLLARLRIAWRLIDTSPRLTWRALMIRRRTA